MRDAFWCPLWPTLQLASVFVVREATLVLRAKLAIHPIEMQMAYT